MVLGGVHCQVAQRMLAVELAPALLRAFPDPFDPVAGAVALPSLDATMVRPLSLLQFSAQQDACGKRHNVLGSMRVRCMGSQGACWGLLCRVPALPAASWAHQQRWSRPPHPLGRHPAQEEPQYLTQQLQTAQPQRQVPLERRPCRRPGARSAWRCCSSAAATSPRPCAARRSPTWRPSCAACWARRARATRTCCSAARHAFAANLTSSTSSLRPTAMQVSPVQGFGMEG